MTTERQSSFYILAMTASVIALGLLTGAKNPKGNEPSESELNSAEIHREHFLKANPQARFYDETGRITRIYGKSFSNGDTAEESAEKFRLAHSGVFGVEANDLVPVGPFEDGRHVQPVMYIEATDSYKFTGLYYTQQRDGVPVFRSRLTLIVRNEENYPLVLASADLRDIGNFQVPANFAKQANEQAAFQAVRELIGNEVQFEDLRHVIWAGVEDAIVAPVLALEFIAEGGDIVLGNYQRWLFVADAPTGAILHQENLVYHADVTGFIRGMATQEAGADSCEEEFPDPLPYARVNIGTQETYTDINGDFTFHDLDELPVVVESRLEGLYFNVDNFTTPDGLETRVVTPPGEAYIVHSASNDSEFERAEVNGYIEANLVRDFALSYNPAYPVITNDRDFPVRVNIPAPICNALYSNGSINFFIAGGGCANTAFSSVVHHEYGHHLVATGGSGQGAYGEGMSDCVAMVIADDPCLGKGFQSCFTCLRSAINSHQYPCSGEVHHCGMLISGCVWDTRNELVITEPDNYRDIIANLTINSILLHNGSGIAPNITVDFLTLDDDDADITNGTPHYNEIATGFGKHNMHAPPLGLLHFNFPNGRPEFLSASGSSTIRVEVSGISATPQPGTGKVIVDVGPGGFVSYDMTEITPNVYDAVMPAVACGDTARYYFSARTTTNVLVTSPGGAPPTTYHSAIGAEGLGPIVFDDDFESDQGWTVQGFATSGQWERGNPITNCAMGNPLTDADGSGACYLTENNDNPPDHDCDSNVGGGSTTLISPLMDASAEAPVISYWRWFNNATGSAPYSDEMTIEFSSNDGASWSLLETVGPNLNSINSEVEGSWYHKTFSLNSYPSFTPSDEFRIRFTVSDVGSPSRVEAGIDGVKLQALNCGGVTCPPDLAPPGGDGQVNVDDLLVLIGQWGVKGSPADLDLNGAVNVNDLLIFIGAWGPCP